MNHKLTYKDIHVCLKVMDDQGYTGIITDCDDVHNINVVYDQGGAGLYCFNPKCHEFKKNPPILYNCYKI